MTAFTASFAGTSGSYTFTIAPADTDAVPGDTVALQNTSDCSTPTLSWSPLILGLFGADFTPGSQFSSNQLLTIARGGPQLFTLTATGNDNSPAQATLNVKTNSFVAAFAGTSSNYTLTLTPADKVAVPGDTVTVQNTSDCSTPTLSWSPGVPGLFGVGAAYGSQVSDGQVLTIALAEPEMFTLTATGNDSRYAAAPLYVRPDSYAAIFVTAGGDDLTLWPVDIVRPNDQLTLWGVPSDGSATLSWSPAGGALFGSGFVSGTSVINGQVLIVGDVAGVFTLTVSDGDGSASAKMFVNAMEILYDGTTTLDFLPCAYVNHGDSVQVAGLPAITSGSLTWTDSTLFVQSSPLDLTQSQTLTISNNAAAAQDTLTLTFVPADGSTKVVAIGRFTQDSKTGTGQLDPTGDDKTLRGQGARRRASVATRA